ncbi:hypothetical protein PRIPAC_80025 [Pristionchus pacificus]|uniref:Uncharacterized protein n=1 Tax=Pristionchus pacificus TaxID=54126 RepID=A0A2A6CME6_PRIPA|nr:hypothetical protein PRIPAC_80025 [Pristionchus pacificus]|eukprot:PDM79276.1 hypothetical protein PRIPAC_31855 [Pristionchus pacificus]
MPLYSAKTRDVEKGCSVSNEFPCERDTDKSLFAHRLYRNFRLVLLTFLLVLVAAFTGDKYELDGTIVHKRIRRLWCGRTLAGTRITISAHTREK